MRVKRECESWWTIQSTSFWALFIWAMTGPVAILIFICHIVGVI